MIMDNRFLTSRRTFDADALRYLNAVQLADGQALEPEVAMAVNRFVKGCKADGIWSAIKAACIMCGARTISGALVPLVGTAPTPYNFASGDYDRETGLVGDGSTKYLDSNRANNADGQDDQHISVYVTAADAAYTKALISSGGGLGSSEIYTNTADSLRVLSQYGSGGTTVASAGICAGTGLFALSRSDSSQFSAYASISFGLRSQDSQAPTGSNIAVFSRSATSASEASESRLAFYSIGSALDLAALDNRVSTLVSAIAAAL